MSRTTGKLPKPPPLGVWRRITVVISFGSQFPVFQSKSS